MNKENYTTLKRNALLLNVTDLPSRTGLKVDVEANTLKPYILMARDIRLKPLLKHKLYDKVVTDWIKDIPFEGEYDTIYNDYVVPILCYYTLYYLCAFHSVQITETGLQTATDVNYTTVELNDAEKIAKRYENLALDLMYQFEEYLSGISIPELSSNTGCGTNKTKYNSLEFV